LAICSGIFDRSCSYIEGVSVTVDLRDPLGLAVDAPLLRAYLDCLDRQDAGEQSFHTPGHKGSEALTGVVVAGDHPLAGGLDTIKMTRRWLPEAERRAAALYGADVCRFSAGGSTHCNQALALSVGVPGDSVVVSRTLHRSLLLGLVLAGLVPIWVEPEVSTETGLPLGYAPERVARALAEHPEAKAVFLGDPSYVGTFSDIGAHAAVAHDAGVPLLVDAAWAAHFGFHPALPPHALAAGADAMITSAHKTLPAYSQAALMLARTERLDASRLDRAFEALHTTSPAGTIMASMDAARALLQRDGERLLSVTIDAVAEARDALRRVPGVVVLEGPIVDAAKLTVSIAGTGAHGVEVESDLMAAGVPVEMADRDTIVAICTLADDASTLRRYTAALTEAIERRRGAPRPVTTAAGWIVSPQQQVAPRDAFFGPVETVAFGDAIGRVSAELVALYPPGVPVLAPGELVTEQTLTALTEAAADGIRVAYAADPGLATLQVLK
jgi:arginine decarboxylase